MVKGRRVGAREVVGLEDVLMAVAINFSSCEDCLTAILQPMNQLPSTSRYCVILALITARTGQDRITLIGGMNNLSKVAVEHF